MIEIDYDNLFGSIKKILRSGREKASVGERYDLLDRTLPEKRNTKSKRLQTKTIRCHCQFLLRRKMHRYHGKKLF